MGYEPELTPGAVRQVFDACLHGEGDRGNEHIVTGVQLTVTLHYARLQSYRQVIYELLRQLPDAFMVSDGGGQHIVEARVRRDGQVWTVDPHDLERLVVLGIAVGLVEFVDPRSAWFVTAGPYIKVLM